MFIIIPDIIFEGGFQTFLLCLGEFEPFLEVRGVNPISPYTYIEKFSC